MNQLNLPPANTLMVSAFSEAMSPEALETNSSLPNDGVPTSVGFIVLFSSFVLLICSLRHWKTMTVERSTNFSQGLKKLSDRLAPELPCRHCHYFQANCYLPCAVNPIQVLTLAAVDCGDFRKKSSN